MIETKECRICLNDSNTSSLISPCQCDGSIKWVHEDCLDRWVDRTNGFAYKSCDICKTKYKTIIICRPYEESELVEVKNKEIESKKELITGLLCVFNFSYIFVIYISSNLRLIDIFQYVHINLFNKYINHNLSSTMIFSIFFYFSPLLFIYLANVLARGLLFFGDNLTKLYMKYFYKVPKMKTYNKIISL